MEPELEGPLSSQTSQGTTDTPVRKMVPTPSGAVLTEPKGLCSDQSVPRTGVGRAILNSGQYKMSLLLLTAWALDYRRHTCAA